jgi:hypothetical protein
LDIEKLHKFLFENKIKSFLNPKIGEVNRFVTHHYIGEAEIDLVISKIKEFY